MELRIPNRSMVFSLLSSTVLPGPCHFFPYCQLIFSIIRDGQRPLQSVASGAASFCGFRTPEASKSRSLLEASKRLWRRFDNLKRLQIFFGVISIYKKRHISNLSKANLKPLSKKDSQSAGASAPLRRLKPHSKATPEAPFWSSLWPTLMSPEGPFISTAYLLAEDIRRVGTLTPNNILSRANGEIFEGPGWGQVSNMIFTLVSSHSTSAHWVLYFILHGASHG